MRKACLLIAALLLIGVAPATASAEERELTLYSPAIKTLPSACTSRAVADAEKSRASPPP